MNTPLYSSPALHLTPHTCVDVHANTKAVVLGYVGDRATFTVHLTADQAMHLAECLILARRNLLAAGGDA